MKKVTGRSIELKTATSDLNGARRRILVPLDVIRNPTLSAGEKSAILALWACDANDVPDVPSLRQLEGGIPVCIDDIL
ncbi:MAG: hypothetical protein ABIQ51_01370 [Mesorhizobium sp.]